MDAKALQALPVGRHVVEDNLYLLVSPTGTRSWIVRLKSGATDTMRTVGRFPAVSITAARRLAAGLRTDAQRGLLVATHRKVEEPVKGDALTLDAVWTEYARVALASGKWTQRHHDKTDERVRAHMDALLTRPVADITRAEFVSACAAVPSTETGQRIYRWLRGAVEHAVDTGVLQTSQFGRGVPLNLSVPAADRGTLRGDLDIAGQRALYRAAWDCDAAFAVRACHRAVALSGHRIGAVREARAEHLDLEAGTWVMPRALMKVKDQKRGDVVIQMSGDLLAVMTEAHRRVNGNGYLFSSPMTPLRCVSAESVEKLVKRHATGRWTPHSWRSAVITWAIENGFDREVAMAAIDHQRATGATVAYDASKLAPQVSELLSAWGAVLGAVSP